jgi:DNA-binding NarL/FixJ family response regulator
MPITVSIIEDDAQARAGFAQLVDTSGDCQCISQHESIEAALPSLAQLRPNVVLVDINLPGMSGVEGVHRMREVIPQAQFMMLTVYEDSDLILSALKAGATGYLLKRAAASDLISAVRDVHAGGSPMTSQIARKIVQSFQQPLSTDAAIDKLSAREAEVLELLARGFLYKEIADKMRITYATVNTHIRHIYEKLQVHSRTEAVSKHLRNR